MTLNASDDEALVQKILDKTVFVQLNRLGL